MNSRLIIQLFHTWEHAVKLKIGLLIFAFGHPTRTCPNLRLYSLLHAAQALFVITAAALNAISQPGSQAGQLESASHNSVIRQRQLSINHGCPFISISAILIHWIFTFWKPIRRYTCIHSMFALPTRFKTHIHSQDVAFHDACHSMTHVT
jgi:hypothetical protein